MVPLYGAQLSKQIPARCSIPRVARDFFASFRALLNELRPVRRRLDPEDELRLSQYCYVLAIFEQRARVVGEASQKLQLHDLKPGAGVEDLLGLAHPAWVRDIGRMSWLFGRRYSRLLHERVRVHPAFRSRIGPFGADADLLVNDYLIDIKVSVKPQLHANWLYQVLGYALLDGGRAFRINGVGFYLARQGVFIAWPLKDLLQRLAESSDVSLSGLSAEFRRFLLATCRS